MVVERSSPPSPLPSTSTAVGESSLSAVWMSATNMQK
jgi:hypothetical protein